MHNVLLSGETSFNLEVPYKLLETGREGEKPLMVYLHGFSQNIDRFQDKLKPLIELDAYHLFVQGPYPLYDRSREKKVEDWGRAWYLYDGDPDQFVRSLEQSSAFLQEIVDTMRRTLEIERLCLVGYSMGGYLAGYFALSRWNYVNELVVVGARIKTEVFEGGEIDISHQHILALHGKRDESVKSEGQRQSVKELKEWGARAEFREIDEGHRLTRPYLDEISDWLTDHGYSFASDG